MPLTVVIADDHPIVLNGLKGLIGVEPQFSILGFCNRGDEVLRMLVDLRPDLAVLDLNMPGMTGLQVLNRLRSDGVRVAVILLAASVSDADVYDAVKAGAAGLMLKEEAPHVLIDYLGSVARGGRTALSPILREALARETTRRGRWTMLSSELTSRELELVKLAIAGESNKSIAFALGLTEGTVKVHFSNVFRKLNVQSRAELMDLVPARSA
jgi:DNA-binding NarL/FixJ family response regulator